MRRSKGDHPQAKEPTMPKYMVILRTSDEALAKVENVDVTEVLEVMGKFNDELIEAGVVRVAEGLADAREGVVIDFTGETPVVVNGPYGETRELFNGFYILDVASQDEAVEWAKKTPLMYGTKIEVRRVPSVDEFPQDEWTQREREWREKTGQL
jgi:hypothetical protein